MITGFHHTGVVVHDLPAMTAFYQDVIGLELLGEIDSVAPPEGNHTGIPNARRKLVFLGIAGDHQIELVHYLDPPAAPGGTGSHQLNAMHICFMVDDLRGEFERLQDAGVRFLTEPKFSLVDGREVGVVYGQDPEGNWIEFIEGLPKFAAEQ
tara:strand:+ start:278 stop:733 length:456 start_codon:yes stop_codon:yes gene_type:complete